MKSERIYGVFLLWMAASSAIAFCDWRDEDRYWSVSGSDVEETDFSADAGRYSSRRQVAQGPLWRFSAADSLPFRHDYRSVTFAQLPRPAQTNGDLHTTTWGWMRSDEHRHIVVAPAVSVSSNALKNPDQINADALQLVLSWQRRGHWHGAFDWLAGACADHRFGHFKGYPVLGVFWSPTPALQMKVAYPDASLRYRVNDALQLGVSYGPDGGQWQVFDDALARDTALRWESQRLQLDVVWRFYNRAAAVLAVGWQQDQRLALTLEDNSRLRADVDDGFYTRVGLRWYLSR